MGPPSSSALAQAVVSWAERIARARSLAASPSPASNILTFYANLTEYQRNIRVPSRAPSLNFVDALNVDAAAGEVQNFIIWLERHGPPPLAKGVSDLRGIGSLLWKELMVERLVEGAIVSGDDTAAFVVDAVLQPFAEDAAQGCRDAGGGGTADLTSRRCPTCGGRPVVGALREEGQGTRRVLICALCGTEWPYLRVRCAACEEDRFDALPVYTAAVAAHVRIDACDTCHIYMKTVDQSREGEAVPVADDLATVPLDLWARDRGYQRLYPNLLRL